MDNDHIEQIENELVEEILSEFRSIGIDTSNWEYEFGDGNNASEFIAAGIKSHLEKITPHPSTPAPQGDNNIEFELTERVEACTSCHGWGQKEEGGYSVECSACKGSGEQQPEKAPDVIIEELINDLFTAHEKIDDLTSQIEEMRKDWISVEDSLPEKKGYYLVCVEKSFSSTSGHIEIGECYSDLGKLKFRDYVTHWQPLPQPPTA